MKQYKDEYNAIPSEIKSLKQGIKANNEELESYQKAIQFSVAQAIGCFAVAFFVWITSQN